MKITFVVLKVGNLSPPLIFQYESSLHNIRKNKLQTWVKIVLSMKNKQFIKHQQLHHIKNVVLNSYFVQKK